MKVSLKLSFSERLVMESFQLDDDASTSSSVESTRTLSYVVTR
jgi:hypothetical protein